MKKFLKITFIGLLSLLLVAGLASILVSYFYSDRLEKALVEEFESQTAGKYSISVGDFDLGLLSRSVSADSILVEPNSNSAVQIISANSLSINQIKWISWFGQRVPDFGEIEITEPYVEAVLSENASFQINQPSGSSALNFTDSLSSFNFILKNGSGVILEENTGREIISLENLSLEARDVNASELFSRSDILFMDDLTFNGSGLNLPLHDKFYEIVIGEFNFDKLSQLATISDFKLLPTLPKYEFSEQRGYQLDRIHLEIPEIELQGFELDSLANKHFDLDTLRVNGAWLEVFRNKQIPRPDTEATKPLFYELASATNFSFGLSTALVNNTDITYEEHRPPSDSSGSVSFNDLSATLSDFKTMHHPDFNDAVFRWDVETLFMNISPLSVQVEYPIHDPSNSHTVRAQLESIDPKEVGGMLRNVGFVEIEHGFVEGLNAEMDLNSETSTGEVMVQYRDLKVNFLDKDDPDDSGIKEGVKNFIANTFAINTDNTGEDAETGQIDFEREKNKSIFAYWWKSLLSGLKDVIQ